MPIKTVIKFLETLPLKIISQIPWTRQYAYQYVLQQVMEYESHEDHFCSLYRRPKHAAQYVSVEKETSLRRKTAIIMQGPLISKDDFTIETVKTYGKLYPGVTVVVTTWEDENPQLLEQLCALENCHVVLSKRPMYSGVLNLNYQVVSTMAGLRRAKELGLEYAAKTRNDFRFVKIGLIEYLIGLCNEFPIDKKIGYQQQRIVVMGDYLSSFFRAFWVADRFSFGQVDDMLSFWDYELDAVDWPRPVVHEMLRKDPKTWREVTEAGLGAESQIMLNYLKRMEGEQPECTVKNFWDVLKKQFITVAYSEIGAYWTWTKAYQGINEATVRGDYYGEKDDPNKCLCYNWDFARWLALYLGYLRYEEEYEQFQLNNIGF